MLFVAIALLLFVIGIIFFYCPQRFKKFDLWIAIAVAVFFVFVFPYGKDTGAYVMVFERASSLSDSAVYHMQRNIGFNILMLAVKLFSDSYVVYRLVFNGLTIGLIGACIFKYSRNKTFSWFLLFTSGIFVVYYGSAVRQCIAMAIFMFGYFYFYLNRKYLLYCFTMLLSFSFHEIGLFGFLPWFMDWLYHFIKKPKKYIGLTLVVAILGYALFTFVMPLLFDVFGSDSVITHGLLYFKDGSFSLMGLLLRVLLMGLYTGLYSMAKPENGSEFELKILNAFYGAFLLYVCFANFSLMSRAADYIGILELIYLPNLLVIIKPQVKAALLAFVFVLYGYLALVDIREQSRLLRDTSGMHYPIVMVWDQVNVHAIMEGRYD